MLTSVFLRFSLFVLCTSLIGSLAHAGTAKPGAPAAAAEASAPPCMLDMSRVNAGDADPDDLRAAARNAIRIMIGNMDPLHDDADPNSGHYVGEVMASAASPPGSTQVSYTQYDWSRDDGITIHALITALLDDDLLKEDIFNNPNHTVADRRNILLQHVMDYLAYVKSTQSLDSRQLGTAGVAYVPGPNGTTIKLDHPAYGLAKRARDNSEPDWMNPQIDGPGYRDKGIIKITEYVWDQWEQFFGPSGAVRTSLSPGDLYRAADENGNVDNNNSSIKNFLQYIRDNWTNSTYEMWEEEKEAAANNGPTFNQQGGHFATLTALQAVMMFDGPRIANKLGDGGAASDLQQVAIAIDNKLNQFWDSQNKIIVPSLGQLDDSRPNANGAPKFLDNDTRVFNGVKASAHIDTQVTIGLCHSKSPTFTVTSDKAMSYVYNARQLFKGFYPINQGKNVVLMGRYINDIYSGITQDGTIVRKSQPWSFTTTYDAEYSYRWANEQSAYAQLTLLMARSSGDINLDGKQAQLLFGLAFKDNAAGSFNIFNRYQPTWSSEGFTLKASDPMYGYLKGLASQRQFQINDLNVAYLNDVLHQAGYSETVSNGQIIDPSDSILSKLVTAHILVGDLILREVIKYSDAQGGLSEQIDPANDGQVGVVKQRSAPKLTWSSASVIRARKARKLAWARANQNPTSPSSNQVPQNNLQSTRDQRRGFK